MSAADQRKNIRESPSKFGRVGAHSALFRAGAKGRLDGRSAEARFLRDAEFQLIQHVGGRPSVAERVLISRLARIILRLSILDDKIATGQSSDYDLKVCGGLDSALRHGLSRLGFKGTPPKAASLADITSRIAGARSP
jgi:hypothetical protein